MNKFSHDAKFPLSELRALVKCLEYSALNSAHLLHSRSVKPSLCLRYLCIYQRFTEKHEVGGGDYPNLKTDNPLPLHHYSARQLSEANCLAYHWRKLYCRLRRH